MKSWFLRICISWFTCFVLLIAPFVEISGVGVSAAEPDFTGFIPISTKQQLADIGYNQYQNYRNNYYLTNDIVFTDEDFAPGGDFYNGGYGWTPIGTFYNDTIYFSGIFDGNGHKIKGLRINWPPYYLKARWEGHKNFYLTSSPIYVGLFGNLQGTVRNLEMDDYSITVTPKGVSYRWSGLDKDGGETYCIGSIAGNVYGGTIDNCTSNGHITISYYDYTKDGSIGDLYTYWRIESNWFTYVGGIAGSVGNKSDTIGKIVNCRNTGEIISTVTSDFPFWTSGNLLVGGIVGSAHGYVDNCRNEGHISLGSFECGSTAAGGIAGTTSPIYSPTTVYELITNCCNTANISVVCNYKGAKRTRACAAGIVASGGNCLHCFNTGNIAAIISDPGDNSNQDRTAFASGISNTGNNNDCYNTGNITSFVASASSSESPVSCAGGISISGGGSNCYNTGSISAGASASTEALVYAGGISAENEVAVTNCYNTGSVVITQSQNSTCFAGGIAGKSINSISACHNSGDVTGLISGGIVGQADGGSSVKGCYNTAEISADTDISTSVSAKSVGASAIAGGIIGKNNSSGPVSGCYNTGPVSASYFKENDKAAVGGIIGFCADESLVTDCYNTGAVTGTSTFNISDSLHIGGIAGVNGEGNISTIKNCYNIGPVGSPVQSALIGGIAGYNTSFIDYCYYLNNTTVACGKSTHDIDNVKSCAETQMKQQNTYTNFDFNNTWTLDPNAGYPYPRLQNNLQKYITGIAFYSYPKKVNFITEDALIADGVLSVYYSDGTFENVDITLDMLSDFDMNIAGKQTVTVTYKGYTLTYNIFITQRPEIIGMELVSGPNQTTFVCNTALDYTGAVAKILYIDGSSEQFDITPENAPGAFISRPGTYTVTFACPYRNENNLSVSFTVTVVPVQVIALQIVSPPNTTHYVEGQEIDTTGLVVQAVYNNGVIEEITDYTLIYESRRDTSYVTVEYAGVTAQFDVIFEPREVISLVITSNPRKMEYYADEDFDPSGMVVTATYNDGTSETVTEYIIAPMPQSAGRQPLTISYGGKSTVLYLTINVRTPVQVIISKMPNRLYYHPYEQFDPTGLQLRILFDNGTYKITEKFTSISSIASDESHYFVLIFYESCMVELEVYVYAEHQYGSWETVYVATCTDDGLMQRICSVCGKNETKIISAKGHQFGEWKTQNAPTCTQEGFQQRLCIICNKEETRTLSALEHDWETHYTVDKPANCSETGVESIHCTRCSEKKDEKIIPITHSWETLYAVDKPATCSETGLESIHCSLCNATKDARDIPALGHSWETHYTVDKSANCTETGVESIHCTRCSERKDERTIPAFGHKYGEPIWRWATDYSSATAFFTCANDNDSQVIDAVINIETTAPTYTKEGKTVFTAKVTFEGKAFTATQVVVIPIPTDYTALREEVSDASISDLSAYTEESAAAYTTALEAARAVLANGEATQQQVDDALESLRAAKNSLEKLPTVLKGDADGDGRITSTDARLTLQLSVGKISTEAVANAAVLDVDGDGKVTSTDARLILQYSVGKITEWA